MPLKCCVYGCNTNYETGEKGRVHKFPADATERQRWIRNLPNQNFTWTPSKVVCYKHWPENAQLKTVRGGSNVPIDAPSVFPGIPASCVPSANPRKRTYKSFTERSTQPDELPLFQAMDKLDVSELFNATSPKRADTVMYKTDNEIVIKAVERTGTVHAFSIYIALATFAFQAFCGIERVDIPFLKDRIEKSSQLDEAIHFCSTYSSQSSNAAFISRQLSLLSDRKFDTSDFTCALSLRRFGMAAYNAFRDLLVLPSTRLLRKLTQRVDSIEECEFLKTIFGSVDETRRWCYLLVDEVYVKQGLQFQGEKVFGEAQNEPGAIASTVLTAMITFAFGGPKHCLRLSPVANLESSYMVDFIRSCCIAVERSGGKVIAVICDNNRVNQRAYSELAGTKSPHPWRTESPACPGRPMYLLPDKTHLLKSIRNNWITESLKQLCFVIPPFLHVRTASWSCVEALYSSEKSELFKQARLTRAAAFPNPIERQNMKHVLAVFCDETVASLRLHGEDDTADFVSYVLNFWKVCNVHSKGLGARYNDRFREEVTAGDGWQLAFLEEFSNFANCLRPTTVGRAKSLTRDTFSAIRNFCSGVPELCKFLFSFNFDFILLGTITTDPLEKQFGKFRQSCGGNYLITVRSIIEKHRLDKTRLFVICGAPMTAKEEAGSANQCVSCKSRELDYHLVDVLPLLSSDIAAPTKEVMLYVAGYVAFKHCGVTDDDTYEEYAANRRYFDSMNRGKLTVPPDSLVTFVYYMYTILMCISADHVPCFHELISYCKCIASTYGLLLAENTPIDVFRCTCHILLNNFTSSFDSSSNSHLIKLAKLSSSRKK